MRSDLFVFLSGCLTFGVPLLFALRELVLLRRGRFGGWRPDPAPEKLPKPLPPCLLVPFQPPHPQSETRTPRVLEPA